MPKDVNEFIADDFIRHSIDLDRLAAGERKAALSALRTLEKELVNTLKDSAKLTSFQAARTEALLQQTQATIAKGYGKVAKSRRGSLDKIYEAEKAFVTQTVNDRIGSSVMTVFTDERVTRRAVDNTLIQGAPSSTWWKKQATGLKDRFEAAVRTGILAGETNDQIARRIRGTRANSFKDGVMSVSKREADALTRTSVQAVANKARLDTYEENVDIVGKIQQRSTLDTRTTDICISYSGLVWKMVKAGSGFRRIPDGHSKKFANVDRNGALHFGPPRHWQCRSALVPLTPSWEELAGKKVKPKGQQEETFQKKFEDRLRKRGFTPDQIKSAKAKTRASMNGQVPVDLNYEAWLKTQPKAIQIDALGPERWKLWNAGRIQNLSQLTDNLGRPLTIDEYLRKVPKPLVKSKTDLEKKLVKRDFNPINLDDFEDRDSFYKKGDAPGTSTELTALDAYTGDFYTPVNNTLRGFKKPEKSVRDVIDKLKNLFNKTEGISNDVVTYRGVKGQDVWEAVVKNKTNLVGKVMGDPAFKSTTLDKTIAEEFIDEATGGGDLKGGVILKVRIPKGHKALFARNSLETEILLNSDVKFRIAEQKIVNLQSSRGKGKIVELTVDLE